MRIDGRTRALAVAVLIGSHAAHAAPRTAPPQNVADGAPPGEADVDDDATVADVGETDVAAPLRGKTLTLHVYRPTGVVGVPPVVYSCGDGGWRGLAPRTAEQLAHAGSLVVGVDTKAYLKTFASDERPLTLGQVAADYAAFAAVARAQARAPGDAPVMLVGWSLGAAYSVAAAGDAVARRHLAGVVAIGLTDRNQLAPGVDPDRSSGATVFRTTPLVARVSPLPLAVIQAASDSYLTAEVVAAQRAEGREPFRFVTVRAKNHRYSGARLQFYAALADAVAWVRGAR